MRTRGEALSHYGLFAVLKAIGMGTRYAETLKQSMRDRQLEGRGISDQRVIAAMTQVPRERFIPSGSPDEAYADRALPIGFGQTISQPYMVALMTEALELTGDETVLEIGTGSGYQTAILAELTRQVLSIERLSPLAERAERVLELLGYRNVTIRTGDGTLGWPDRAPFTRILATAMAETCPPSLFEQLAEGGILVIPLGNPDEQILEVIRKEQGQLQRTPLVGCRFVPLIGKQGWQEENVSIRQPWLYP